ncbi:MAG: hypothetical protein JXB49_24865 [Bacteroidales bacterium]|nr:hypothetical protein [Bacteroidales bacterium]
MNVIQIYSSLSKFDKIAYNAENRRDAENWPDSLKTRNGYVKGNKLYLPDTLKNNEEFRDAKTIIITERIPVHGIPGVCPYLDNDYKPILVYKQVNQPKSFEIFRIQESEPGIFQISLDYTTHASRIGIPKRDNHKIGELCIKTPLRYKINGKSDFTFTGRKQRTYYEFDYVFEFREADRVTFVNPSKALFEKVIPKYRCKLVDERKLLR